MAFLERFKGRTNQLTREGICSTITTSSTPINKQSENVKTHSLTLCHKDKQSLASPKESHSHHYKNSGNNGSIEVYEEGLISHYKPLCQNQSQLLRLRTSEETYDSAAYKVPSDLLLHDRRANTGNTGQSSHSYVEIPSHKEYLINTYSMPRGKSVLSNESLFESPQKVHSYSPAHGKIYAAESPNVRLKSLFKHPSKNNANFNENPYFMGTPRDKDFEAQNLQELRLSRFSFIERQEQLLSKYRVRPDKEENMAYRNTDLNRSPERIARGIL